MAIERAVVKGMISNVVATRNMFTCDVVPVGGDTQQVLWEAYLFSIYEAMVDVLSNAWASSSYELQTYSAGSWVPYDELTYVTGGTATDDRWPNAVAIVLIAKAAGLRHVGRKFFSPVTEVLATANSLVGTAMISAASGLLAYITPFEGIGGGTITPGVVDKTGTFHPFVGGFVSSLLGSIRRRKPGIGI